MENMIQIICILVGAGLMHMGTEPCPEIDHKARADSLQEIVWMYSKFYVRNKAKLDQCDSIQDQLYQCSECCSANNEEIMQLNRDMAKWHAGRDSAVKAMYNRMIR